MRKVTALIIVVFLISACQISTATQIPTRPPLSTSTESPASTPTILIPTANPTNTLTPLTPTAIPTEIPTATATPIVLPIEHTVVKGDTLGSISQFYGVSLGIIVIANNIADPNLIFIGQVITIPDPSKVITIDESSGKQITVILSLQRVYAIENGVLQQEFIVSTGLPNTPTVLGDYIILDKIPAGRMTGPGYDLPDVPWIMHFYQGYSFHGAYWHNNFGYPMSHGCVNMKIEDAKWLYDWATIGTPVQVLP